MWDDEFLELMPTTVQWQKFTSTDEDGNLTWANPVPIRARVQMKSRHRGNGDQNARGQRSPIVVNEANLTVQIRDYGERDRITISGVVYAVYSVTTEDDEDGPHHFVLFARQGDEA